MVRSTKSDEEYDLMSVPRDDASSAGVPEKVQAVAEVVQDANEEKIAHLEQKMAELDERFMHGMSSQAISMLDQRRVNQLNQDHKLQKLQQQMMLMEEHVNEAIEGLNHHIASNTVAARKAATITNEHKEELTMSMASMQDLLSLSIKQAIEANENKWSEELKIAQILWREEQKERESKAHAEAARKEEELHAEVALLRQELLQTKKELDVRGRMQALEDDMSSVHHKVGRLAIKSVTSDNMLCRQAEKQSVIGQQLTAVIANAAAGFVATKQTVAEPRNNVVEALEAEVDILRNENMRQKQHMTALEASATAIRNKMETRMRQCEATINESSVMDLQTKVAALANMRLDISNLANLSAQHTILLRNASNPLAEQNKDDIERLSMLMADYCEINVERINNLDRRLFGNELKMEAIAEKDALMTRAIAGRFASLETKIEGAHFQQAEIETPKTVAAPRKVVVMDRPIFGFNTRIVSTRRMNPDELPTFGFAQRLPTVFTRQANPAEERPIFSLKHSVKRVSHDDIAAGSYNANIVVPAKSVALIDAPIPRGQSLPVAIAPQMNQRGSFAF